MIELVTDAFSALQQEASLYPGNVQIWMRVMAISLLLSVFFVWKRSGARWILAAFVVNIVGLVVVKITFPELSRAEIGTYIHVLFWLWVLSFVWHPGARPSLSQAAGHLPGIIYFYWLSLASIIMAISLLLDFRNLIASWF